MKARDKDCDVDVSYKKDKIILKRTVKTKAVYQMPDMATKIKQRTFLLYSNILGEVVLIMWKAVELFIDKYFIEYSGINPTGKKYICIVQQKATHC